MTSSEAQNVICRVFLFFGFLNHKKNIKSILKNSKFYIFLPEVRSTLYSKIYIYFLPLVYKGRCTKKILTLISPKKWGKWGQRSLSGDCCGDKSGGKSGNKAATHPKPKNTPHKKLQPKVYVPP
jgi:hypothetical protein